MLLRVDKMVIGSFLGKLEIDKTGRTDYFYLIRTLPYLIFVTGAMGGARVNFFLAGVNFFQLQCKRLTILL